jgi:hypothetical protein
MSSTRDAQIQRLLDRHAIVDLVYRYCRGVDRNDRTALERVYWPDSVDDHVHVKLAGPDYVEHVLKATTGMRTAHHIGNMLVEFDSPTLARCESYFLALHEMPATNGALDFVALSARYLDRFEKRGDEWRIRERTLVFDFQQTLPAQDFAAPWLARINRRGGAFPDDPVYTALAPAD